MKKIDKKREKSSIVNNNHGKCLFICSGQHVLYCSIREYNYLYDLKYTSESFNT